MNPIGKVITGALIMLLQVFVFDNLSIGLSALAIVYTYILLSMEKVSLTVLLLVGFSLGMLYDLWHDTLGMHASMCTWLALLKWPVDRWLTKAEDEGESIVHISYLGWVRYLYYILIFSLIGQFIIIWYTFLEWNQWLQMLVRIGLGALLSTLIMMILEVILYRPSRINS